MTRFHRKKDGILAIEDDGSARFLTWFESILWQLGFAVRRGGK